MFHFARAPETSPAGAPLAPRSPHPERGTHAMNMKRTRAPSITLVLSLAAILVASTASRGTAQSVTYSGRAYGAQVKLVNPQPNILIFSDTGNLPPSGGSLSATLLSIALGTTLSSTTISASTQGSAGVATSTAHQENALAFSGQPAQVSAAIVESHSRATRRRSRRHSGSPFRGPPVAA